MNYSPCLSITLPECFRSINYCVHRNYLRLWEWHESIIISKRSINKTSRSDKIWSVEHLIDGWIWIKEWKWKWWRICQRTDVILFTFMLHNSVIFNADIIKYLCETCLYYLRTVEIHDLTEALKSLCCDCAYALQLHQHLFSRSTTGQGI